MEKEYEVEIHWKAFPLHPEIPEQGMTLEDLFAGRGLDIPQMMAHLRAVAQKEELPLNMRTMTFNTRFAQELGKWAEKHGKGDEFHNAVFRAYFVQGKNIGDVDELVSLSESVGLSGKESRNVLKKRTFKEGVSKTFAFHQALQRRKSSSVKGKARKERCFLPSVSICLVIPFSFSVIFFTLNY